nr:hypothetical protein [Galbitalea soli]
MLTASIALSAFALWLVVSAFIPEVAGAPLQLPTASLAALSGFLASLTVRDTTARVLPALLFSLAWTLVVFVPIAVVVLFPAAVGLGPADGPLDLGGALPVHAAVGAGAIVVLTVARGWSVDDRSHARPHSWLLLLSGLVIWVCGILCLAGLELGVDSVVTPRIVLNAIVAPVFGSIAWLVVQRIRSATTTATTAVAGLVSGLVAISAGAASFTALWAGVTGAAAGFASALFFFRRYERTGRHAWFIVAAHLMAAVIGLLMVGLFGTDFGFIYNGQTDLIRVQFLGLLTTVVWSGGVSIVLWLAVRGAARREAARVRERAAS